MGTGDIVVLSVGYLFMAAFIGMFVHTTGWRKYPKWLRVVAVLLWPLSFSIALFVVCIVCIFGIEEWM